MNTKGHPLGWPFAYISSPSASKSGRYPNCPLPCLSFHPKTSAPSSPPRSRPACPILWYLSPAHPFPRSVHRAPKKSPALPGDHQTRYGQGRHAPRPMTGTAFFEGKGGVWGERGTFSKKKVPLSPSTWHHSTPGPRGPARKRSFPLPSRRRRPRRSPHVRLRPDGAGPGHP